MSASVRDYLEAQLKPLLPGTWTFIPNQTMPETISQTVVILKHGRIEKLPAAPIGHLLNTVTLTIVDPHVDEVKAENALDDAVVELCSAIDGMDRINWSLAEKVTVKDPYIGWDITLTVITEKES